ncbi:hypothetical protein KC329_g119 [Hortaea werneckii]|nr:hypothetical protein KC329_g119 [Hortaea werneckii]
MSPKQINHMGRAGARGWGRTRAHHEGPHFSKPSPSVSLDTFRNRRDEDAAAIDDSYSHEFPLPLLGSAMPCQLHGVRCPLHLKKPVPLVFTRNRSSPCIEVGGCNASPTPMFSVLLATGLQHTLMMQQWINNHGTDPCKCCSSSHLSSILR